MSIILAIHQYVIIYIGLQHPLLYIITKYISSNIATYQVFFWPQKAFIKRFVCCCSIRSMYWVQKTFILNGKMVIAFIKKGRLLLVSMRTITALSYKRCIHRRPYFSPLQFSLSKMKTDFLILYHIRINIQVRVSFWWW